MPGIRERSSGSPPACGVEVDGNHPQARGLVFLAVLTEGAGMPIDWARRHLPETNNAAWNGTRLGTGLRYNGSQFTSWLYNADLQFPGSFSAMCGCLTTAAGAQVAFAMGGGSGGFGWRLETNSSTTMTFQFSINGGETDSVADTIAMPANRPTVFAGVHDADTINWYLYRDGALQGTFARTGHLDPMTQHLRLGALDDGSLGWTGEIYWAALWNRALQASEVAQLTYDPFAVLLPQRLAPPATTSFRPAWAQASNRVISGGVWGP